MAADFFLGRAFALHLLEPVAVAQQLEVLPRREQQDEHQEGGDGSRLPQLAVLRLVDLADDRVVADVLLDCVLEWLHFLLLAGPSASARIPFPSSYGGPAVALAKAGTPARYRAVFTLPHARA